MSVYLDNAAATPCDPRLIECLAEYAREFPGNQESMGYHGAADDEVGIQGQDFFDIEVGYASDAFNLRHFGWILAEVGTTDQQVASAESEDYLGDGRGE